MARSLSLQSLGHSLRSIGTEVALQPFPGLLSELFCEAEHFQLIPFGDSGKLCRIITMFGDFLCQVPSVDHGKVDTNSSKRCHQVSSVPNQCNSWGSLPLESYRQHPHQSREEVIVCVGNDSLQLGCTVVEILVDKALLCLVRRRPINTTVLEPGLGLAYGDTDPNAVIAVLLALNCSPLNRTWNSYPS